MFTFVLNYDKMSFTYEDAFKDKKTYFLSDI
jgi:hypothetical protein